MIQNLGRALSILAKAEAKEIFAHADVDAFHAPSECHALVRRGEGSRLRRERRRAEAVAHRPMRCIIREARKRGVDIGSPRWLQFVGRVYEAQGYPF